MLQEAGHINDTVVLISPHIQCLYLMYSEVAWVPVSSVIQIQLLIRLDPDYLSLSFLWFFLSVKAIVAVGVKLSIF